MTVSPTRVTTPPITEGSTRNVSATLLAGRLLDGRGERGLLLLGQRVGAAHLAATSARLAGGLVEQAATIAGRSRARPRRPTARPTSCTVTGLALARRAASR